MGRKLVTQELVDEAAEMLLSEGKVPTLIDIQARIGGSYTSVKKHLDIWVKQRSESSELVSPIPPDVDAKGRLLTRAIWQLASQNAQREIENAADKAAEVVATARSELSQAINEIARLERIESDLSANAERQQSRIREAELALAEVQAQASRATALEIELGEFRVKYDALQKEVSEKALAFGRASGEAETLRSQMRDLVHTIKPSNIRRSKNAGDA